MGRTKEGKLRSTAVANRFYVTVESIAIVDFCTVRATPSLVLTLFVVV